MIYSDIRRADLDARDIGCRLCRIFAAHHLIEGMKQYE